MGSLELVYKRFADDAKLVTDRFSDLRLENDEFGVPNVIGKITLYINAQSTDEYFIRIKPTALYPTFFPLVYETERKIPLNIDWHLYDDGAFCLCTVPEQIIKCTNGVNLFDFIENEVKPFLFNQTHKRLEGYFVNERKHGHLGEDEFYQEYFGTTDTRIIKKLLEHVLHQDRATRTENCICGSGKKYRKCHRGIINKLKKIDPMHVSLLIHRIENYKANPMLKAPAFVK